MLNLDWPVALTEQLGIQHHQWIPIRSLDLVTTLFDKTVSNLKIYLLRVSGRGCNQTL